MREVGDRYTAPPEAPGLLLRREGLSVSWRGDLFQTMIGGDLNAAGGSIGMSGQTAGLYEITDGRAAAIRIARDRMLLVSEREPDITEGWHGTGWAATRVDDGYAVLEISGEAMPDLLRQGSEADFEGGSPSAAILFSGCWALLYRSAPDVARLHVEAFRLPYIVSWLAGSVL